MEKMLSKRRNALLAIAAAAVIPAMYANAAITNTPAGPLADPRVYQISASGATALGALTRGATTNSQNFPTGENNSLWRLGTASLQIGRSTYTANVGAAQLLSWRTQPTAGDPRLTADIIQYQYHEVGSINGILETAKGGGLFLPSGFGNELDADTPSQSAPLWRQGWQQINATTYIIDGAGTQSPTNPGNWAAASQGKPRIGYTDVRSFQAFAADDLPGTPSPDRRPRDLSTTAGVNENAQYGRGRAAFNPATGNSGTNFQALANRSVIAGETGGDPGTSFLRNETLAIVPFAIAANPGTGLSGITEDDGRWLQGAGRLKNGANFNSTTREIGSGTRNQGTNNLNIDASFGGGERDRRSLNAGNVNDVDVNGQAVTIRPGDEMNPNKDLFGVDASLSTSVQPKEHRVGPLMRFADKSSGGSGVRPTVVNNRMALGILSVGDVGDRGIQNLDGTIPGNSRTDPMRVLKINWDEQAGEDDTAGDDGFVQPTAEAVTNGRYQMWSAAQAVTVIGIDTNGDGKPDRRGTVSEDTNPNKLIWGDVDDQTQAPNGSALGSPVGPAGVGVHRKFLNNINQSVSNFPSTSITPADGVIAAGFIPQQVMKVDKDFDGGTQTWSNSPEGFNESLYNLLVVNNPPGGSANLKSRLNWIDPSVDPINGGTLGFIGDLNSSALTYKIFALDVGNTSSTPTKTIRLTQRNVLAGDMDGNGVRDLDDVEELAQAYAASETQGNIASNTPVANLVPGLSSDDLIVLTDFNGSGNIDPASTNAAPIYRAVDRNDVLFFLKGATIDTTSANPATGYAGSTNIQTRREDGVRLGKLKKNEAIDRFNTAFLAAGGNAALTIQKSDANGDGVVDRRDARLINDLVGTAPYSLTLEQVLVNYDVDPIYSELTDDDFIGHVDPDGVGAGVSDFQVARAELAGLLLSGDADIDGDVDIDDFGTLASNFNGAAERWSDADFDFDGLTTIDDFGLLATNFNQVAPGGLAGRPAAVPEPAAISALAVAAAAMIRRRRA